MAIIYETENFIVKTPTAPEVPHNARCDGGHLVISPKISVGKRQDLTPRQIVELAWLTQLVGEAYEIAMNKRGIDIARINYQDNGNYTPTFHLHLYGRARSAKRQPFGQPFIVFKKDFEQWKDNEPLNDEDITMIKHQMSELMQNERYNKTQFTF